MEVDVSTKGQNGELKARGDGFDLEPRLLRSRAWLPKATAKRVRIRALVERDLAAFALPGRDVDAI